MTQIFSIPFNNTIQTDFPLGGSLEALTDSSGVIVSKAEASPIYAANDSQAASEDSTEHGRIAALWQLPDCAVVRTQEAALILSRSVRTLQNWRYKRVGPAYQLGRIVTYRISDLKAYIEGCTTSTLSTSK